MFKIKALKINRMLNMNGLVHFINSIFDYWFQNEKQMCETVNKIYDS